MPRVPAPWLLLVALAASGCDGSSKADDSTQRGPRPADRATAAAAVTSAGVPYAGRVTHQGAPVEGAVVVFASRTTGEAPDLPPASLFTDATGRFQVPALPRDVYDVVVVGPDGLVGEAALDLTGPAAPALDVALVPAEVAAADLQGGALQRLLGAGPLDPDLSLLSEDGR